MTPQFWLDRWSSNEIGFHQRSVNEYLQRYWPQLNVPPGTTVFVPLCGKSLDMHWLRERGHRVIGVELAHQAVADFFSEWGVTPEVGQAGPFERWRAQDIELLCGDFFDLTAADLAGVRAVFDRAALIALPPDLREAYAAKLHDVLPPGTPTLLVTADYPQQEMSGPPFAVSDAEVRKLFGAGRVQPLAERDILQRPENERFRQRGLTRLIERVYRID
ncbi:MAG TPA: thiopurine S-methyltransferase [Povalibacter sp.]|uniref:thiopurine S-methyltransferase n=1 Tax=Povalibacter sp. TaxID=1962978 RepID=UPI002C38647C|nr:thiopurine S-methyltransferase [Povalibacter sp.]HMN44553.1 thiopurine S-methyltransferase [Povalibacter sp.]